MYLNQGIYKKLPNRLLFVHNLYGELASVITSDDAPWCPNNPRRVIASFRWPTNPLLAGPELSAYAACFPAPFGTSVSFLWGEAIWGERTALQLPHRGDVGQLGGGQGRCRSGPNAFCPFNICKAYNLWNTSKQTFDNIVHCLLVPILTVSIFTFLLFFFLQLCLNSPWCYTGGWH